jgi:hypothetical protein
MIDCEKGLNKFKAAKAMVSTCRRRCSPAPLVEPIEGKTK